MAKGGARRAGPRARYCVVAPAVFGLTALALGLAGCTTTQPTAAEAEFRVDVLGESFVMRVRDPETHKRAMILAAIVPIGAAFARMRWIPGNDVQMSYDPASLLELALLAPALVYDKLRRGRVHRAYWIGLALTVPWLIAAHFVWYSPAWRSFAVTLLGAP